MHDVRSAGDAPECVAAWTVGEELVGAPIRVAKRAWKDAQSTVTMAAANIDAPKLQQEMCTAAKRART